VVTIADLASLEVEADVSESSLVRVKQGQPCEIQLDALPDERFRGVLQTIVPTADRSKASVMVKVRFIDRDLRVMPEMSAKVAFLEKPVTPGEQHPKTAVSPAVVAERGGRTVVFVVKGDRASERVVTLGPKVGDLVEVTAGVKAGEKIIASPMAKLKDGVRVKLAGK
jgi:RND family efflux transporter MFP subunit